MKAHTIRQQLLATTIIGGLVAFAAPVMAQTQPAATQVDEVVVTGSRIVRQDFTAISPVTTVGQEQLELTQTLTVESLLNELPQVVPGNMRTSNNSGGEAFATIDLRGLGANRNLVLVNGERIPGSSTTGTVDLNTIPASLVQRVEVVTGGASAVYGSDAISGVVNFILKDNYEGAEMSVTYGSSWEGNAPEIEINGIFGGNFANGRGNMTAYGAYYNRGSVSQSEFDFSRTSGALCSDRPDFEEAYVCDTAAEAQAARTAGGGVLFSGGSATPSWGWIANSGANPFNAAALIANPLTAGQFASYDHDCNPATANIAYGAGERNLSFDEAGNLEPRNGASNSCGVPDRAAGSSRYNYAPDNYLIIPAERVNFTTIGTYDFSDTLRAKVHLNYVNSSSEVQLAPTPATGLTVSMTPAMQALISASHPDLAAALASRPNPLGSFTLNRRMNEVGTRNSYDENNSFYLLTTLEGEFSPAWDWSLTASYGSNKFDSRGSNSVNATALAQGLAGCQDATSGLSLGVNALPGCVALDLFGAGTMTDAMTDFVRVNTFSTTQVEETRIAGYTRGNLFSLPAGPVASVFGFEYRETDAEFRVDNEQRTGNIFGFNATQDQAGAVNVQELYTEISVPLLADMTYASYLGLELGLRYSDYSSIGSVWTSKVGLEFAPIPSLRFRAVYNEATRAPSVFELFQNGDQGFPSYIDPCVGATGADAAFCSAQTGGALAPATWAGFTAANSQVEAFSFGNPNLEPETAQTFTVGFVFQPDFLPVGRLSATVDYYDIKITDVIASFGAQYFINDCYDNAVASSCARVVRDTNDGQIDYVNTSRGNQGEFATNGVDLAVEYSIDLADVGLVGRLRINELASFVDSFTFNGSEFVGTTSAGIGGATFDFKNVLSAFYDIDDWTFMTRWSYLPELADDPGFGFTITPYQPEASYIDMSARWNVTDNVALSAFIGNVLDEKAPQTLNGIFSQGNTDPQVYRVLGRTFSLNARMRF
ncbi:TonB-dependent siderophore receptor [Brevundimonas sp.]|uniref:TonB-dependent receptor plug domain-containing protein n=1 Tax=Brevundimonas sp. TaxID=1871086 RepID=UPI002489F095|nr:TonB-dependent receptor [Brevundimonas sp.]MDI1281920.1 TonB-dependent receptor [Brevundimonas sp.]